MASKLLISLSFFAVVLFGRAQTADFYFHNGSKHYVFGEKEKAKTAIGTGLQKFPQDPQLNSLAGLLKKEEKEKKPSSGSENKDQEKDKDQKSESQKQQDKKENEEQQKDSQQAKDEQKKQEQQKQDGKEPKPGEKEGEQQEAMAMAAGQMTPEQARQFLDAQKQEDKALIFAPPKDPKQTNRKLKDW